jgi:hypothetical protein
MRSPSYDVDHCEDHHPHGVDKVPVKTEHLNALRVTLIHASGQSKDEDKPEHKQTDHYVGSVQPDE